MQKYSKKEYEVDYEHDANKEISAEDKSNVVKVSSISLINQESYLIRSGHCIALIIGNREFNPHLNLRDRKESVLDASVLFQRFGELGFECNLVADATDEDILTSFNEIKADKNKLQYATDCLVVVVLSHGEGDCIYATNRKMKIKSIMDEFNLKNCPELMFKPKIFIFDAADEQNFSGVPIRDNNDYDFGIRQEETHLRIPNEPDFLAVYSTLPGHACLRRSADESIFILYLSYELSRMKKGEDIYTVLLRVNRKVGNHEPKSFVIRHYRQMPYFVSHLTKELILKQ